MLSHMNLYEHIEAEFKRAMKTGDALSRLVLGMLKSAIRNKAIEKGNKDAPVSDDDAQSIIVSEIKKRKDSAAQYRAAGRGDLADNEAQEAAVLARFLPPQLSEDDIRARIVSAIEETGAATVKDMGKVLAALTAEMKGKADMSVVAKIVKESLS